LEGSGRGLIAVVFGIYLEGLRKTTRNSIRIASLPDEIRTAHLPNRSFHLYGYAKSFGGGSGGGITAAVVVVIIIIIIIGSAITSRTINPWPPLC
jgi:hypothetical protein